MNWARPKTRRGSLLDREPKASEQIAYAGAFGDFNAPLPDGTRLYMEMECESLEECLQDMRDVQEADRVLTDPKEKLISADDLRKELGL